MRYLLIISAWFVSSTAVSQTTGRSTIDSITGTFIIDLRPTPNSQPYLKEFKIIKLDGIKFDGEFYGYPFTGGFLNTDWEKLYFAFTTKDQSGTYYHSGSIEGDKIVGITLNESRGFVLPWKGERSKEK